MTPSMRRGARSAFCHAGSRHSPSSPLRLFLARSFWQRAAGLFGHGRLGPQQGLWIKPCKAVHTVGLGYAIDIVFIGPQGKVLKTVHALKPNRVAWCLAAHSVVELPAFYCRSRPHYQASLRQAMHAALCRTAHTPWRPVRPRRSRCPPARNPMGRT